MKALIFDESAREAGKEISGAKMKTADKRHAELFARLVPSPRPLEGAVQLLRKLSSISQLGRSL
jgi:hypothetical protein